MLNQELEKIKANPKKLFLIDGLGAILSALLLGVVLVKFERIFGIPPPTLYILAALPLLYAIYDFSCYGKENLRIGIFLKGIAIMNLLYCCFSAAAALYHLHTITVFGWSYILLEISLVTILAIFELRSARRLMHRTTSH